MSLSFVVSEKYKDQRVDKVLQELFPQSSVRSRKLLWQEWVISLNGRKTAAGATVRVGDVLCATPRETLSVTEATMPLSPSWQQAEKLQNKIPVLLKKHDAWLFFAKPRGLHCAAVAGRNFSLEEYLGSQEGTYGKVFLCNRLDAQTSGIVVAAQSAQGVQRWQDLEAQGLCEKRYVALVHGVRGGQGNITLEVCVKQALDTDKRKITRVLPQEAETVRQTHFTMLHPVLVQEYQNLCEFFPSFPQDSAEHALYMMGCTIYKGARHQIRAHAAHAGFPLWNDARYVRREVVQEECFLLHHGALHFQGQSVYCAPVWEKALQDASRMETFWLR